MAWQFDIISSGVYHISPFDDSIGHELTDSCVCVPHLMAVPNEDGSILELYTHSSLDGRELREKNGE